MQNYWVSALCPPCGIRWTKSRNPMILSIIHRRLNTLESIPMAIILSQIKLSNSHAYSKC
jgi:hypothetical protein